MSEPRRKTTLSFQLSVRGARIEKRSSPGGGPGLRRGRVRGVGEFTARATSRYRFDRACLSGAETDVLVRRIEIGHQE